MTKTQMRWTIGVGYALLLTGIVFGMFRARTWATQTMAAPQAQSQWETFREDVAQQSDAASPVRRRVPQSTEPPALVLMRDHFATCLVIALVLCSALYACLALFAYGVAVTSHGVAVSDQA